MKKKSIFYSMVAGALIMTSCQKEPITSFTTDKTEYIAGETVKLTNTTTDGDSYKWTMPDGQTSTAFDVDYTLNINDDDGTLTFKLEAFSKNGKKNDETSKSVNEKAAKGDVTFWNCETCNGVMPIVVSLNGTSSNITSYNYTSAPSCGASGCAVFNSLKVGTYNYTAYDSDSPSTTWSGSVTIGANGQCVTMKLL